MSSHIDVMSYLLAVLTFSVGFLSTRRHAHVDVLTRDLADRSWKIRQSLNDRQNLGPKDLAEDLASVVADPDRVSLFARVANALLFLAIVGVYVAALTTDDPINHGVFLVTVVLLSSVVVFALGEYDVISMAAKERDLAAGTILGRLSEVDRALSEGRARTLTQQVSSLQDTFPSWTLARELELLVALAAAGESDVPTARDDPRLLSLLERSEPQLAPLMVAEVYLRNDDSMGALREMNAIASKGHRTRLINDLESVLSFRVGLPRFVFDARPETYPDELRPGIDADLRSLRELRRVSRLQHDFVTSTDAQGWLRAAADTPVGLAVELALSELTDDQVSELVRRAVNSPEFAGGLNTIGLVALAQDRASEALRLFEAAIRARPNSSTSHWGRAVACAKREWYEAARNSLRRAKNLDPKNPVVLQLTTLYVDHELDPVGVDHLQLNAGRVSELARVQMAILGLQITTPKRATGVCRQVVDALVTETAADVKVTR